MHIFITGGTGYIGEALCQSLRDDGHSLTVLSRQRLLGTAQLRYIASLDQVGFDEHFDAVINLAGASLADRRWTREYKREIVASRLDTTAGLIQMLGRLNHRPRVLLNASAIGYYGHQGDEPLMESDAGQPGFAQDLCVQWEQQALEARELGIRVCLLRLGVVLDSEGGAFARMALPFRFGVANWLGSGEQWLSWVHRADVVRAMRFLLADESADGPFNVTAPHPVTSRGFCDAMKRHSRTLLTAPVPAPVLRLMVGDMAEELLLNGQRVLPVALQRAGFSFSYPDLDTALTAIF